jgi:NAD(P)H-dependent flavin oxidoreductase YrpB (nitropropane dioxygenase family)
MLPVTSFTRLVDCRLPIQQAGMGGVTTPELVAAVAREGGLGMVAAAGLGPNEVVAHTTAAQGAAGNGARVGVSFLMPFLDVAALEAAAEIAAVVECFYGDPDPTLTRRVHDAGALAAWQVGSLDEALAAVDAGCDLVVVQGREAGGHVRGTTALLPLLAEVRDRVEVPLVAAGGIGSGRAMADALRAGADGVRIGTRLVATVEADAHPEYTAALIAAGPADTVLTEAFSLGWPTAPHRVLQACVDASPEDPALRTPFPPTRAFTGDVAAAALYAGESVAHVASVAPVATVLQEILTEAADALA